MTELLIFGSALIGFGIAVLTDIQRDSGNQTGRRMVWAALWVGFLLILVSAYPSFWAMISAGVGAIVGLGYRRWLRTRAEQS
jgi:polyferredoxin